LPKQLKQSSKPYLKRSSSIEELLPWLYLRGISTGDYQEALGALLGDKAKGIGARRLCQPRHGVTRVDDATRAPEPLLHHPLGRSASGEIELHSPAQTSYGRRIYL